MEVGVGALGRFLGKLATRSGGHKVNDSQVPDALGEEGRVQMIVSKIKTLQADLFELDLVRIANAKGWDEAMPATDTTYHQRRLTLQGAIDNIAAEYGELWAQAKGYIQGATAK